jgi:hypothetical protein
MTNDNPPQKTAAKAKAERHPSPGLQPATTPDLPAQWVTHGLGYVPERGIYVTRDGRFVVFDAHEDRNMLRSASGLFATLAGAQRHVRELNKKYGEKTSLKPRAQFLPDYVDIPSDTPPGAYYDDDTGVYVAFLPYRGINEPRAVVTQTPELALALHLAYGSPDVGDVLRKLDRREEHDARQVFDRLMAEEDFKAALMELAHTYAVAMYRGEEVDENAPHIAALHARVEGGCSHDAS